MRVLAIIGLLVCFPIMLLIALCIYIESRDDVLFNQKRIGLHKKTFIIHKFRTMSEGQITAVGRVIRKIGLDELPQLFNILKGDMSFVGPRPLTAFDVTRLGWDSDDYSVRWSVKPGITGLAQLSKVCSADNSIKNDLYYIKQKSVYLDIKIFVKSLLVPFFGKQTH